MNSAKAKHALHIVNVNNITTAGERALILFDLTVRDKVKILDLLSAVEHRLPIVEIDRDAHTEHTARIFFSK